MAKKKMSLPVDMPMACSPSKPSKADIAREKKWQAEDDLRTMQRVEEIKKDKGRVAAAKSLAKEQMSALKKVC